MPTRLADGIVWRGRQPSSSASDSRFLDAWYSLGGSAETLIHVIPEITIDDGFMLPLLELSVETYLARVNHVAEQRLECILVESMSAV